MKKINWLYKFADSQIGKSLSCKDIIHRTVGMMVMYSVLSYAIQGAIAYNIFVYGFTFALVVVGLATHVYDYIHKKCYIYVSNHWDD